MRRGNTPAAGYQVEVHRAEDAEFPAPKAEPEPVVVVTTDEAGEYEATLWTPGDYMLLASTPSGTPAGLPGRSTSRASRRRWTSTFRPPALAGANRREGKPLPEARVILAQSLAARGD